ncbi:unnamed protein product [Penicillium glandicola]
MEANWVPRDKQPYIGNALIGATSAIIALQIVFVAARFYTRFLQHMKIGVDDYLILLALSIFILEVLDYPFTITPAKIALLLFYRRIFTTRKFRILIYIVGAMVLAVGIGTLLENFLQCRPFAYIWDESIPGGTCNNPMNAYRFLVSFNVLTGILILVMPIPTVWSLHVSRGQKLAVTGVFLLGGIGTVVSIAKLVIYNSKTDYAMKNPSWFLAGFDIFTVVEGGMIIIAACLISIWPLFTRFRPRCFQTPCSRHMPPRSQHRSWYSRATHTKGDGQEDVARYTEVHLLRDEAGSSSPSLPSSLADLEDQRWSILTDEDVRDSHKCGSEP